MLYFITRKKRWLKVMPDIGVMRVLQKWLKIYVADSIVVKDKMQTVGSYLCGRNNVDLKLHTNYRRALAAVLLLEILVSPRQTLL